MSPLDLSPKNRSILMRIIIGIFLLETVVFLFFFKYVIVSNTGSYSVAISALADTIHADIKPELETEQFIGDLKSVDLGPVMTQKIKRAPFSVIGALISLKGDNIQVFEYPDYETASKEGLMFARGYTNNTKSSFRENTMHLYIKDKIIIFYMGKDKDILTMLRKNEEFSL